MSGRDIVHGRRGGGWLDPGAAIEAATPVLTICPHGDLAWTAPSAKTCMRDGKALKPATKADAKRAGLSLDYFERFGLSAA
jgi:hypothetical protein